MRVLIVLYLCGLSVPLSAQAKLGTFTSPDGVFRFEHSEMLVDCMSERPQAKATTASVPQIFVGHPVGSSVPDSCTSMGGICGDLGSEASTIACYAYPKSKFKDKPTFGEAAFFVGEVEANTTEKDCLEPSQYWNVEDVETRTINAVRFKVFHSSSVGLGHYQGAYYYRTFHRQKCYELGIQQEGTNPGAYDPGTIRQFTKQDNDEVESRLNQALDSFRFVK